MTTSAALLVSIAATTMAVTACESGPSPPEPIALTMVTGGAGGAFYPLGLELEKLYEAELPDVRIAVESGGSGKNVQAIEDGHAQIAFTQADVAYVAYRQGTAVDPQPYAELRGMAVLWTNTVQLAVPLTSTAASVADLRGRRIAVGTPNSGSETLARIVLESYGLGYDDLQPEFLSFADTATGMREGRLDAAFVSAGVPTAAMIELSQNPGVRLLPIPRAHVTELRAQYPFLQPLVIPARTYHGVEQDVATLGVSNLLICRKDLDEDLVYRLTKAMFDALPRLSAEQAVARLIDVDQAPATPIPLHAGAARYYREREIRQ